MKSFIFFIIFVLFTAQNAKEEKKMTAPISKQQAPISKQQAPFTELAINRAQIDNVSSWMSYEVSKNTDLPRLPGELWSLIVEFTIQEKRKDAVIIGDYILTVSLGNIYAHITSVTIFVRENGQKAIENIHQRTFGSIMADHLMQREVFTRRLTISALLALE